MKSIPTATWGTKPASTLPLTLCLTGWLVLVPVTCALAQSEDPGAAFMSVSGQAQAQRPELGAELRAELPSARLRGVAKLNVWGFDIYNASLWTQPGFEPQHYAQHNFALDLAYLRAFESKAIVKRSLDEMKRLGKMTPEQAQAWQTSMAVLFPNVKAGDRITGVHRAGTGAAFWLNGKATGEINDVEFARLFFGIWLAEGTSEPTMRQLILGLRPA